MQRERREWLAHLTTEQARRIFNDLHQDADKWKRFGGDLKALEERRIASKINGRRIFMLLYERSVAPSKKGRTTAKRAPRKH